MYPYDIDLSELKDSDIEEKIQELTRKYFTAQRLGKAELLTPIANFITMYKSEMSKRHQEKMKANLDNDLDQLINVN